MANANELSLRQFWAPKYWPTWVILFALRLIALLPFSWQIRIGVLNGRLLKRLNRKKVQIADKNLEICFPELAEPERASLLERHFRSVGLSMVEMSIGWFASIEKLRSLVEVVGREHLDAAINRGRGVLLVGAHFTTLEVGVAILADLTGPCVTMYRPQRNAMMDVLVRRGRRRFAQEQIPRDNVRTLIKRLRDNKTVVYLPDQTYLGNQSALIPFFGEPAVTNTATPKLSKISGAVVLPYFFRRKQDDSGYVVDIGAPLENFPSDDAVDDTRRLVSLLEKYIRQVPDQYLWLYKKFKRRPVSYPNIYA